MKKYFVTACLVAASAFSSVALAEPADIQVPDKMTCKEFVNLNPQSWAPVALWVISKDTQYPGGDFVALSEKGVAEAPKIVEFCKKFLEGTLQDYLAARNK
ncbi:HdeA/HdeB family chaperone [Morganella morganii]|uniref:HdeA/HdeB family chaperone n=1 Tax=Morganella morganii TaxID=582 RepID=UPI0030FEBA35